MSSKGCTHYSSGSSSSVACSEIWGDDLSAGAIVGIVIGCIVGVLLIILLIVFIVRCFKSNPVPFYGNTQPYSMNNEQIRRQQPYVLNYPPSYYQTNEK